MKCLNFITDLRMVLILLKGFLLFGIFGDELNVLCNIWFFWIWI